MNNCEWCAKKARRVYRYDLRVLPEQVQPHTHAAFRAVLDTMLAEARAELLRQWRQQHPGWSLAELRGDKEKNE